MKLEEKCRSTVAEANYRVHQKNILASNYGLEEENLDLSNIGKCPEGYEEKRI